MLSPQDPSASGNRPAFVSENDMDRNVCCILAAFFIFVAAFVLVLNQQCLFYDWDGVSWAVVMEYMWRLQSQFSLVQFDPLQGLFGPNYQAYRGGVLPVAAMQSLGVEQFSKTALMISYLIMSYVSIYFFSRSNRISRTASLLAASAYSLLAFPFLSVTGLISPTFALNPNFFYMISLSYFVGGLFIRVRDHRWPTILLHTSGIVVICTCMAYSMILHFVDSAIFLMLLGVTYLFLAKSAAEFKGKLITAILAIGVFSSLGFANYLIDMRGDIAYSNFAELGPAALNLEMRPIGTVIELWADQFYRRLHGIMFWVFLIGAIVALATIFSKKLKQERQIFIFFMITVIFYFVSSLLVEEYWGVITGNPIYRGPVFYYFSLYMSVLSFICIFSTFDNFVSIRSNVSTLSFKVSVIKCFEFAGDLRISAITGIALIGGGILFIYAVFISPEFSSAKCPRASFNPLEKNKIVEKLAKDLSLYESRIFRGSAATFIGSQRNKLRPLWIDNVTADVQLWNNGGNDMRTIGLWKYGIPTLEQVNALITAQYYLTLTELLADSSVKQMRNFIGLLRPVKHLLPLWGVKYVVSDKPQTFGKQILEMPIKLSTPKLYDTPIRLIELEAPNVGDYSPTDVIHEEDASATLDYLRDTAFDGRQTVITDSKLEGNFVPATHASMEIRKGNLLLRAKSDGDSILVLPVQYSHCWDTGGIDSDQFTMFRANLMQLGIRFSKQLDIRIGYRFGPFWHSSCKDLDSQDVQRLNMVSARTSPD